MDRAHFHTMWTSLVNGSHIYLFPLTSFPCIHPIQYIPAHIHWPDTKFQQSRFYRWILTKVQNLMSVWKQHGTGTENRRRGETGSYSNETTEKGFSNSTLRYISVKTQLVKRMHETLLFASSVLSNKLLDKSLLILGFRHGSFTLMTASHFHLYSI